MKKLVKIIYYIVPIILMVWIIPLILNDYLLTFIYLASILVLFYYKREKNDLIFIVFWFFWMLISETIFIKTGVETFIRNSLFGIMPLWLPFLWSYWFLTMKKIIKILDE